MKTLEESEDEYDMALEELLERFQEGMKKGKDHEGLQKNFQKNFQKILSKRNKSQKKYINNNKKIILGVSDKPRKRETKRKVFAPKAFNFEPTFLEKQKKKLNSFYFYMNVKRMSLWNSKMIVIFRTYILRKKMFLLSILADIKVFTFQKIKWIKTLFIKYSEKITVWSKSIYEKMMILRKSFSEKKSLLLKNIREINIKIFKKNNADLLEDRSENRNNLDGNESEKEPTKKMIK